MTTSRGLMCYATRRRTTPSATAAGVWPASSATGMPRTAALSECRLARTSKSKCEATDDRRFPGRLFHDSILQKNIAMPGKVVDRPAFLSVVNRSLRSDADHRCGRGRLADNRDDFAVGLMHPIDHMIDRLPRHRVRVHEGINARAGGRLAVGRHAG